MAFVCTVKTWLLYVLLKHGIPMILFEKGKNVGKQECIILTLNKVQFEFSKLRLIDLEHF